MTRYLTAEDVKRLSTTPLTRPLVCRNCGREFPTFDRWAAHYYGYCMFPVADVRPLGVSPLTRLMAKGGDDV